MGDDLTVMEMKNIVRVEVGSISGEFANALRNAIKIHWEIEPVKDSLEYNLFLVADLGFEVNQVIFEIK